MIGKSHALSMKQVEKYFYALSLFYEIVSTHAYGVNYLSLRFGTRLEMSHRISAKQPTGPNL